MKFIQQTTTNGPSLVIQDIGIGEWTIPDIAEALTIGGSAYAPAIASYNGLESDEIYTDFVAIPVSWLNEAGKVYYNTAEKTNLPVDINGAGFQKVISGLSTTQKVLLAAAIGVTLLALLSNQGE